jgi:quinol---cytochrome c reductase iron-sulfur subunit, bacillus type
MYTKSKVSRRDAMKLVISTIGGFIGAALGIPAIAYIIGPAAKTKDSTNWIRVGSLSRIEMGKPELFKIRVDQTTGWIQNEEEIALYVLTENGRDFLAMSNICTHLGCRARWIPDQEEFFCPCHNGVFDKHGFVVSGPPPRPLDVFETKIENGELSILLPAKKRSA